MVLRSVRSQAEGEFVPHLWLSVGILLALICVGTLVYFVGHMADRINVDTVIELVSADVQSAVGRLTCPAAPPVKPPVVLGIDAAAVTDPRCGYLQEFDGDGLADWAQQHGATVRLLVRPGDYVFPGAVIAVVAPPVAGTGAAIRAATALSDQRVSRDDLEFAVRQLVEVAVRALSPGINDPHTAISVLDRLGAPLCAVAQRHFADGLIERGGRIAVVVAATDYDGLADAIFP